MERVLERRAEGDRLAAPDQDFLAAAASWVFATPVPESIVVALSTWLERNVSGPLLLDRRLPEPWRHTLFVSASADGTLDRGCLAARALRVVGACRCGQARNTRSGHSGRILDSPRWQGSSSS